MIVCVFFGVVFVAVAAKTFVFYRLVFAVEFVNMWCLHVSCSHRQKPYKTSFVGGQFFRTAFIAKTAKTFVFYPPDCFVIVCQAVGVCLALSFSTKTVAFCFVISCLSLLWI